MLLILIVTAFIGACVAAVLTGYFGIKMSQDLKAPIGRPTTIPLFVRDDELMSADGRRYRGYFHYWLMTFFALCILGAVLIAINHR